MLFPAKDSLAVVRQRLEGIAVAAGLSLSPLPIEVITAPTLRLDLSADRQLVKIQAQPLANDRETGMIRGFLIRFVIEKGPDRHPKNPTVIILR